MLQREFEERVGIKVSVEEYHHIECVYNNADCNKDDFCYYWKCMNKERVAKSKSEQKIKEKESANKDKAFNLYSKYSNNLSSNWSKDAKEVIGKRDFETIKNLGYKPRYGGYDSMSNVLMFLKNKYK